MSCEFKPGELFVYVNGDRWELGMVKSENSSGDGYFCWYHRGDTAANTPLWCMHKLENAGWTHIEQQMDDLRELLQDALTTISWCTIDCCPSDNKKRELYARAREMGIEVDA